MITVVQRAVDEEGVTFLATDLDADGGKVMLASAAPVTVDDDAGRLLRAARADRRGGRRARRAASASTAATSTGRRSAPSTDAPTA